MNNFNLSTKKKNIIICLVIYIIYLYMAFCIPYMDDDWLVGCTKGWDITMSGILNGRFFGNFIMNILVRFKIPKIIIMSIVIWFIPYKITRINIQLENDNFCFMYLFINLMLMLLSVSVWNEVFGWVSGFSIYSISVFFILFYLDIIKDIYINDSIFEYNFIYYVCILFFSIILQLILENITIGILLLSFLLFIYSIKSRKYILKYFIIFIGNIIGTVIMLSSKMISDVVKIGYSVDERSLSFSFHDSFFSIIISLMNKFFCKAWYYAWNTNFIISICLLLFVFILLINDIGQSKSLIYFLGFDIGLIYVLLFGFINRILENVGLLEYDIFLAMLSFVSVFTLCYIWIKWCIHKELIIKGEYYKALIITFVFIICILAVFSKLLNGICFLIFAIVSCFYIIRYLNYIDKNKYFVTTVLFVLCYAPLAAVIDDSPRLFFHGSFFSMILISILFGYIIDAKILMKNSNNYAILNKSKYLLFITLFIIYITILIPLTQEHIIFTKIEKEIENVNFEGGKELHIPDYSNKSRLYMKRLDGKIIYNFYDYYNIDLDVALYVDDEMMYNGNEKELNKTRY